MAASGRLLPVNSGRNRPEPPIQAQKSIKYIIYKLFGAPERVEAVRLDSEGFVLALPPPPDSWLLGLKTIGCEHQQNEMFILPEQISGTLHVEAQGGLALRMGPQPGALVTVVALVSLGLGVSVVGHVSLPDVVCRTAQDSDGSSWFSLIHRRFEKAPAVARYIQQVKHSGVAAPSPPGA